MTRYGINPSFANWTSRLPLFADPLMRGKAFEVFQENGTPTGEPSPLGPDGWPVEDGRWHGVRVYGDGDGFLPKLLTTNVGVTVRQMEGFSAVAFWKEKPAWRGFLATKEPTFGSWNLPSLEALAYFKPKILRTLDWGWQARKEKRPDWTRPRVRPSDPLHGEEMALELQIDAANKLDCHLWWNAPPRFELSVPVYEARLEEMLTIIRDQAEKPPILEYGNELWNSGFPVHGWLNKPAIADHWWTLAAKEIARLREVAGSVFGEGDILGQRPYWLFVGGHIAVPDTLDRILDAMPFTPDIAGPAVYAQPLKVDQEKWKIYEPTQEAMRASVMAMMNPFRAQLDAHRNILKAHDVPFFACYEVGQDMHARGEVYKKAALQAQREPWMGDVYRELCSMLKAAGVHIACWYSAATAQTMDRSFGLLEATLDKAEPLPKARAARGA